MPRDRQNDQHRVVAQARPGEVIHHVSEDKADNSPANLQPMSRADHTSLHNKTRRLSGLRKSLRHVRGDGTKLY